MFNFNSFLLIFKTVSQVFLIAEKSCELDSRQTAQLLNIKHPKSSESSWITAKCFFVS